MGKLKKNERNTSFILKLCFFFLYHSEKIDLLKAIDAANFEEVNKVKLYVLPSKFQRNISCNTYPTKLWSPTCFCFYLFVSFFFSVCAFMGKLLVDCNLKSFALLWVIRFCFVFFNWDSLQARLNSHYEAWSYKKRSTKKITGYRKSV